MNTFNASELYTTANYTSQVSLYDESHPDGHRVMMQLFSGSVLISQNGKDIDLYFNSKTIYLGYIGINKKNRGGVLKELHRNCISILKKYGYEAVKLKPLSSVLTMWIYLGFSFSKEIEEIKTRYLLIDYLKSLSAISDKDIQYYDKMALIDIVSAHKEQFKNDLFPKLVDKKLYYSNLYKEVA